MPIVAASVVPHTPLLLPSIAKAHTGLFEKTSATLRALVGEWYAAKPDVVIVISPHGFTKSNDTVLHSAEVYTAGFAEYGDVATVFTVPGAVAMMHQLKTAAEREHYSLHLQTFDQLDYGTSVPLFFLSDHLPKLPLCSIVVGSREPEKLLRLASIIREFTASDRRRYLVVISADMSRRSERKPDENRRPTPEEREYSTAITNVDPAEVSAMTPPASTCGYGPLLVGLAIIQGQSKRGSILSFEAPLGVGLLTANFALNS